MTEEGEFQQKSQTENIAAGIKVEKEQIQYIQYFNCSPQLNLVSWLVILYTIISGRVAPLFIAIAEGSPLA